MSAPLRVVLDTNIVLSALVFGGGAAGRLRVAWQQGAVLPLASTATVQELVRVLAYPKFRLSGQEQEELLADYLPYAQTVRIPQPPPSVPSCRDPLDAPFMHLAVTGRADVLVSGDRDLLVLADEFEKTCGCPLVNLETFIRVHFAQ
ncbi:MAG TPA: putative toxin-antitoxin system toxin component, PIN family [Burkholderiaceae bacterium]|mgnify:CR=1 FL=1|jgi:putative PIN family toxin of toxin-antitoxin system|nr:putative toxin-antitoxin system toxin component, PIN family [Burkholderiaceae bacterium]